MAKQTDIVGTIRVPEEHYGRFWNFMKSMPTAEFAPQLTAEAPAKRAKGNAKAGTTGRCIVLNMLRRPKGTKATYEQLQSVMRENGKAETTLHGLLHAMIKEKQIEKSRDGRYAITAKGRSYVSKNCEVAHV